MKKEHNTIQIILLLCGLLPVFSSAAQEQSIRPGINTQQDVVFRALKVRHQRLAREQQEIRFLLEDAQRIQDKEAEKSYFQQTVPTMRALRLLQQEIQQLTIAR